MKALMKIALKVKHIEEEFGDYLSHKDEAKAKKLIGKAKEKSFILRHPYLTGIPTLGIAPLIAGSKAKEGIVRNMARSDKKLLKNQRAPLTFHLSQQESLRASPCSTSPPPTAAFPHRARRLPPGLLPDFSAKCGALAGSQSAFSALRVSPIAGEKREVPFLRLASTSSTVSGSGEP